MTSVNTPASKGSNCKRLRVALIASLAVNVLIIGAVGSALLFARHGHGWHGRKSFGLHKFARTLPKDRRDVIHNSIKDGRAKLRPLREDVWSARAAARKVLAEEPFEEAKLKAALNVVVAADADYQRARMTIFSQTAAKLSGPEREDLSEWLERHGKRYRRRRSHWRNEDDRRSTR